MARIHDRIHRPLYYYESYKNCRPDLIAMNPADKIPVDAAETIRETATGKN
jgi:hypothetical protein